jgi:hypothetical protein
MYSSTDRVKGQGSRVNAYTEADAKASGLFVEQGYKLIEMLLKK